MIKNSEKFSDSATYGHSYTYRQKKTESKICSPFSSGRRNRTSGLWVMSPTSYHCSTPRCILNSCAKI